MKYDIIMDFLNDLYAELEARDEKIGAKLEIAEEKVREGEETLSKTVEKLNKATKKVNEIKQESYDNGLLMQFISVIADKILFEELI